MNIKEDEGTGKRWEYRHLSQANEIRETKQNTKHKGWQIKTGND